MKRIYTSFWRAARILLSQNWASISLTFFCQFRWEFLDYFLLSPLAPWAEFLFFSPDNRFNKIFIFYRPKKIKMYDCIGFLVYGA